MQRRRCERGRGEWCAFPKMDVRRIGEFPMHGLKIFCASSSSRLGIAYFFPCKLEYLLGPTMTIPLEMLGIDAKIQRASETIQTLDGEIGVYLSADPKPYRILKQVEEEGRAYSWLATLEADVPLRFSVLAGEIVHHLRSSLDHLICALALRPGNGIGKQGFPVTTSPEEFKLAINRGMLKGISSKAVGVVESVQPFHVATGVDTSLLKILHELNLADKHRLLVVVASSALIETLELTVDGIDDTVPIGEQDHLDQTSEIRPVVLLRREGDVVARTTLGRKHPNVDASIQFAAHVAFEQFGPVDLHPLTPGLQKLTDLTCSIVRQFVDEFQ